MDDDRDRWDRRWTDSGTDPGQLDAVAPEVITAHPGLDRDLPTAGTALDLACGVGAQSLWLARRGLTVTALDVSEVAVDLVRRAADHHAVDITATVWDTDAGLPADLTDLALIVCQRFRARDLYAELVHRLCPGGVLVLTVLSAVGLDGPAGPFHAPAGELTDAFHALAAAGDVEILVDDEGDGQASIVLRRN